MPIAAVLALRTPNFFAAKVRNLQKTLTTVHISTKAQHSSASNRCSKQAALYSWSAFRPQATQPS